MLGASAATETGFASKRTRSRHGTSGRTNSLARITKRLIPPTILMNDRLIDFSIDDEIFKVQKPKTKDQKAPQKVCKVCQELLPNRHGTFCNYCGKPVHEDHCRHRQFFRKPGDRIPSTIDLVCLKKFQVRKMVRDAESDLNERRRVLEANKEAIKIIEKAPTQLKERDGVYYKAFEEFEEAKQKLRERNSEQQELQFELEQTNRVLADHHFAGQQRQSRMK